MLVTIPLQQIPNQQLSVALNGQSVTLNVYTMETGLFADIYLGAVNVFSGCKCNNAVYINQYTSAFIGYLFFYTISGDEPSYLTFGTDTFLYYSDFDALENDYLLWLESNS